MRIPGIPALPVAAVGEWYQWVAGWRHIQNCILWHSRRVYLLAILLQTVPVIRDDMTGARAWLVWDTEITKFRRCLFGLLLIVHPPVAIITASVVGNGGSGAEVAFSGRDESW